MRQRNYEEGREEKEKRSDDKWSKSSQLQKQREKNRKQMCAYMEIRKADTNTEKW